MKFNKIVIKVGSALVAPTGNGSMSNYLQPIASFITKCIKANKEVILVSSGSVAAGRKLIKHGSPVPSIPTKQAMAAAGQMQMMANWQRFFDVPCSQLLITHGDLKDRKRYINIKNTLRILLDNGLIPIINENDTIATEELKVGDNDNLAALVALVSEADCLLILSDIDGLYTDNPQSNPEAIKLSEVPKINSDTYAMAGCTNNPIATGGMKTKIQAAEKATENGIDTFIVNGKDSTVFTALLNGENPGTHFFANNDKPKAKKHWLKHTLKSNGQLFLDEGAVNAIVKRGASLLSTGISDIKGKFDFGDAVDLIDAKSNQIIAKGICQFSQRDLQKIKGKHSEMFDGILGYPANKVIIHRDDLVVMS